MQNKTQQVKKQVKYKERKPRQPPKDNFRQQNPEFFQNAPQKGRKAEYHNILSDAKAHRQPDIQKAVRYVKDNQAGSMKAIMGYSNRGLKKLVENAAFQKTVNEMRKDKGLSRQEAVLSLLYDDFISDTWNRGKQAVADFWSENKADAKSFLKSALFTILPKLLAIGSTSKIKSQDPYAVSTKFLESLFKIRELYYCPRQTLDPLGFMQNQLQIPITTGSSGIATVLINPYLMCNATTTGYGATSNFYPFASMSTSNTGIVYNGATLYAGPFANQTANIVAGFPDQLKTSFICTQNALNAAGKVTVGLYYSAPNASLQFNSGNTFDATTAALLSTDILNSSLVNNVYTVPQFLCHPKPLCRWIPTSDDFSMDLINNVFANGQRVALLQAFIAISFTGCAASTTIGSLFVSSGYSFKPVASQTGAYMIETRGSYPGTHSVLHQLRKQHIPVQFAEQQLLSQYIVQNFANLQIGASHQGFCIDQCLTKIGKKPFGRPWITIQQLQSTYPGLANYTYGSTKKIGFIIDLKSKHAYIQQQQPFQSIGQLQSGNTLFGASFDTDGHVVYVNAPYAELSWQSGKSLINGSIDETHGSGFCCSHYAWEIYPQEVTVSWIQPLLDQKAIFRFKDQKMEIVNNKFWLYQNQILSGIYTSLPYRTVAPFLQGIDFCIATLSRRQIEILLARGNVQTNPGPHAVTSVRSSGGNATKPNSNKLQIGGTNEFKPCQQCQMRVSLVMRSLSLGKQVTMSLECDDCSDPQQLPL